VGAGSEGAKEAPWGTDVARPTAELARLHQAAMREVQLGEMADAGASHRETQKYGAELAAQFRAYDQRLVTFAAANGIGDDKLDTPVPGENVVAMRRQVSDLSRLANERGEPFDRDFWVAIAGEQGATSDMLPSAVAQEPSLTPLVADMSALLDGASRRALTASKATQPPPTSAAPESSGTSTEPPAPSGAATNGAPATP
jgi:hypothetical protein